ncbi:unnamed protein product [Cylicocyclus nassatus]|uniref:Protein sprint n=1 Tax=Cylicocyclus nassatus TaxID=53992 RepID=A0AA36DS76_CYLNA|nr:unnamed protein product [Cylicocyclus nassatus]
MSSCYANESPTSRPPGTYYPFDAMEITPSSSTSQSSPILEDVPAITAVPIPKPRTIKPAPAPSSTPPTVQCSKPVPPKRKPLASSFVNVRNSPCDRDPVDVILDVNNSLWRNIRIEDMDAAVLVDANPSTPQKTRPNEENVRRKEKSGYENDIENDTINVHMEDITSDESSSHPAAYASAGYESDGTISNFDENMMIKGPEWVVPQEYSSSPIVKELAESCDQRPRPPSLSNYAGTLTMASTSLRSTPRPEKKVSLLEQIVRSHPIWYLQHIGRPTATHLLRRMEPGNFIVRASSKPGCMAISVRLTDEHDMHTDHYIVEYGARGSMIRLESSPYSFRSLPLLIEHYCLHPEELQVRLRLPHAVLACHTTKELQSVALMGQDFWTSEAALARPLSRAPQMSTQSTSFMNLDECLPKVKPSMQPPPSYGVTVDVVGKTHSKKRPSSRGVDFAGVVATCANTEVLAEISDMQSDTSNSPPMKHDRTDASPAISDHISRSERRTQSVRTKSVNPPPVSGSSSAGRKSFLKTLFFGGSNSSQNRRTPINQLAQCQYFVPLEKEQIRGSKSAFEIGSPQRKPKANDWLRKHDQAMTTFKPCYDEVLMSARVCPLPMRRERSDLCASSVMRLAKHTERSPGPTCTMSTALRTTQDPPKPRQPLRPPDTARDPMLINNCIDELRRRRLQSTTEMLAGSDSHSPSSSPHVSMRNHHLASNHRDDFEANDSKSRHSRRDHRMSVPNLSPEPSSAVVQSAKALREKLGRNGDGELSTINEGLITPVIRRKQFNQPTALTCNVNRENTSAQGSGHPIHTIGNQKDGNSIVSRGREALEALFVQQQKNPPLGTAGLGRRFNSERVRSGRESELAWRRANHCSSPEKKQPSGGIAAAPSPSSKRDSRFFPNQPSSSWSAINSELKSKQRIAKVRPTLQTRLAAKMTADGMNGGSMSKNSEYAQLSDFSSLDSCKPDFKQRDEDNVSVAGTVFNEPWDSNVWENLLDLASHGDEGIEPGVRQMSETIHEEDSDSDRTPGGSTRMHESDDELDEEMWMSMTASARRTLPSDRVTCKAWENDDVASSYGTVDSFPDHSVSGTLRKDRARTPPHSMQSLPRAISRFSQQVGSLDDLPLSLPALSPNLNSERKTSQSDSSAALQSYVERLAEDESTVFGATLKRFIECTVQSEEADPSVVVRNVRQFINGIKNYLVKHGEGDLHALIDQESAHLNANQILNIDAILEAVLHKLLLKRVKPHLYHVMVKENSRAGGLQALSANIAYVRSLSLNDLGFSNADQLSTPPASVMEQIKICLRKMQHHYSPLKKLENLLRAISIVMTLQPNDDKRSEKTMAADDLVRWLVYILARTSTVGCEVEAWYMWELLPQQMITKGDAAYYLTALFCAIHILKSRDAIKKLAEKDEDMMSSMMSSPSSSASDAFVKVAIPDEVAGCIRYATFPGVPQMTTGKLCRVIAHQQGITNPEDHGLYLIVNGFESCLLPHECPDAIRDNLRGTGKPHLFAYKRHDAKIGWPRQPFARQRAKARRGPAAVATNERSHRGAATIGVKCPIGSGPYLR